MTTEARKEMRILFRETLGQDLTNLRNNLSILLNYPEVNKQWREFKDNYIQNNVEWRINEDGKGQRFDTKTGEKFDEKIIREAFGESIGWVTREDKQELMETHVDNKKYLDAKNEYEILYNYIHGSNSTNLPFFGQSGEGNYRQLGIGGRHGDGWWRGLRSFFEGGTYNERIEADRKHGRVLEDGRTLVEVNLATKLAELKANMDDLRLGTSYHQEDTQDLRDRIDAQIASNERPNRLVELSRQQQEFDRENRERIGNRYGLTIEEKPVHKDNFPKAYELRNLLQIE